MRAFFGAYLGRLRRRCAFCSKHMRALAWIGMRLSWLFCRLRVPARSYGSILGLPVTQIASRVAPSTRANWGIQTVLRFLTEQKAAAVEFTDSIAQTDRISLQHLNYGDPALHQTQKNYQFHNWWTRVSKYLRNFGKNYNVGQAS